MRTALALLVLYANTVAPWLCCCATAKALESIPATTQDRPKPTCEHCCETKTDEKPVPVPQHCPCPVQERLSAGPVDATVEKAESVLTGLHFDLGTKEFASGPIVSNDALTKKPLRFGPTLLTADRILDFHHRLLC